jgi:hypothetical protein
MFYDRSNESGPRIADARGTGVGDQADIATLSQNIEDTRDGLNFGVLIDAQHFRLDAKIVQQHAGTTSVLAAHQAGRT